MSFSSDAKTELCSNRLEKRSLAIAEAYGMLHACRDCFEKHFRLVLTDFLRKMLSASAVSALRIPGNFAGFWRVSACRPTVSGPCI